MCAIHKRCKNIAHKSSMGFYLPYPYHVFNHKYRYGYASVRKLKYISAEIENGYGLDMRDEYENGFDFLLFH